MAVDNELWKTQNMFETYPMGAIWAPQRLYVRDPARTKRSAFMGFMPGVLAYDTEVSESELGETIERSGEVLSASLDSSAEAVYLFNCTATYNCLDRGNSQMRTTPDGTMAIEIKKYAFHPERIGDCNLFKIPETRRVELYVLVGRDDPEDEFFTQYHSLDFTGLKFEEVWEGH